MPDGHTGSLSLLYHFISKSTPHAQRVCKPRALNIDSVCLWLESFGQNAAVDGETEDLHVRLHSRYAREGGRVADETETINSGTIYDLTAGSRGDTTSARLRV
jgi:hypothetical protein